LGWKLRQAGWGRAQWRGTGWNTASELTRRTRRATTSAWGVVDCGSWQTGYELVWNLWETFFTIRIPTRRTYSSTNFCPKEAWNKQRHVCTQVCRANAF
jgi:hypothetical protein